MSVCAAETVPEHDTADRFTAHDAALYEQQACTSQPAAPSTATDTYNSIANHSINLLCG
jgi:hypothetical protein